MFPCDHRGASPWRAPRRQQICLDSTCNREARCPGAGRPWPCGARLLGVGDSSSARFRLGLRAASTLRPPSPPGVRARLDAPGRTRSDRPPGLGPTGARPISHVTRNTALSRTGFFTPDSTAGGLIGRGWPAAHWSLWGRWPRYGTAHGYCRETWTHCSLRGFRLPAPRACPFVVIGCLWWPGENGGGNLG